MLDVSDKPRSQRTAIAEAVIAINPEIIVRVRSGDVPKGDPLEVARVAAIMSAKRTAEIIPFCHPVAIEFVKVEFDVLDDCIRMRVHVKGIARTGMEMEAMTAAAIGAVTIYDMLKMLDDDMEIRSIKLLEKRGGKSQYNVSLGVPLRAAVLVLSDSVAAGKKSDSSGLHIRDRLSASGFEVCYYDILPDEQDLIRSAVTKYCDHEQLDLVVTTGGTGLSPRDQTPEAMKDVFEREAPGIAEAMRVYGQERTHYAMLSRSNAGMRGKTLILNLPGSKSGVKESLDALLPGLLHAFPMIWGGPHKNNP